MDKFKEVNGVKYALDDKGEIKKDDKGADVIYIDPTEAIDLANMSVEQLAEKSPALAAILEAGKTATAALKTMQDEKAEADRKAAEAGGNFETLYKTEKAEKEKALGIITQKDSLLAQKDEILGKYKGSVDTILADVVKTIPKDKQSLIPEKFSSREKLEYITKNAAVLGAKPIAAASTKIEPSDEIDTSDEGKLRKEVDDLVKKPNKTPAENSTLWNKSKELKALSAKNAAAKGGK